MSNRMNDISQGGPTHLRILPIVYRKSNNHVSPGVSPVSYGMLSNLMYVISEEVTKYTVQTFDLCYFIIGRAHPPN